MPYTVYQKIARNRECILSLWQAALLPQGLSKVCASQAQSQSATPATLLLKAESEALLDWLIQGEEVVQTRSSLKEICRLKAVQTTGNPSEALSFILDLKSIVRLVLEDKESNNLAYGEYKEMDGRIDQLLLLAFDEYVECRERVMEIRVDEVRRLATGSA